MKQPDRHILEKILDEISFLENKTATEDYPRVKSWILEHIDD